MLGWLLKGEVAVGELAHPSGNKGTSSVVEYSADLTFLLP